LAVCLLNGFLCFVQSRVFDESVALFAQLSQHIASDYSRLHAHAVIPTAHAASLRSSTHFHITGSAVEVHVQVLDLAVFAKQILDVLFTGLLVDSGRDNDPALDAAHSGCVLGGAGVAGVCLAVFVVDRRLGNVDVHFCVGHDYGRVVVIDV
jgi:hypothetical protein